MLLQMTEESTLPEQLMEEEQLTIAAKTQALKPTTGSSPEVLADALALAFPPLTKASMDIMMLEPEEYSME